VHKLFLGQPTWDFVYKNRSSKQGGPTVGPWATCGCR